MKFDDTARPRYLPLTRDRRLEVDYLLDNPARPVALTVVDSRHREIESDDVVIALAWRLSRGKRRPRGVVGALRVLLDVAVSRWRARAAADRAARHVEIAQQHDAGAWLDEPIAYEVVDQPASDDGVDAQPDSADLWESCFGRDPEAPESYALTADDVDEIARRESLPPLCPGEVA